jgi:hypothetical protein
MHSGGRLQDIMDRIPKMHSGGIGTGMSRDEVLVKMLKTEGVLSPRGMRTMSKQELDYRNATGRAPGGGLTINVPVNAEGNKRLASHLRTEIESTVRKVVVEYAR